ncbi:hypothetical protein IMZ48_12425 [Candidatus Bathyarchaeota archaeon]|nr:hypothetical protein [Candidatus Bathyarchaeota archaeon]
MDRMDFGFEPSWEYSESYNTPNILLPSSQVDPLSVAMNKLIQRTKLRMLWYRSYVSPDMFWPSEDARESPFWPNLEHLVIATPSFAPDGHWYFMGDPAIASHAEFVGEENADIDPDTFSAQEVEWQTRNSKEIPY